MRKIIVTEWMSIDGYISGPEDNMDFIGESFSDDISTYEMDFVRNADVLVLGKITYESFAGSWPYVPDKEDISEGEKEYARMLNSMKKIVYSRTADKAKWENTQLRNEIDIEELKNLKDEDGKNIIIYGSASIVQQLTNLGLIDEYQLLVFPVALTGGKSLFKDVAQRKDLKLVSSKEIANGVVILTYRPISI